MKKSEKTIEKMSIQPEYDKRPESDIDNAVRNRQESKPGSVWLEILDWAKYILAAVLIGFILTNYVIQRNEVVGTSMYPTLNNEDQLWVEKISPLLDRLDRGDIITFTVHHNETGQQDEDLVKRIIGLPGEHVEITNEGIFIDGSLLEESYLAEGVETWPSWEAAYNDLVLGDGMYYVMGDNRSNSSDSRSFGPIHKDDIIGEVWIRIFPLNQFGFLD